ncbi:SDR family NAD(P)-dependent oxidoreductase [Agarivorans sp. DSG3-1]|uniref:SDR family NAD(P)-dependent oxidoreductase n=1 Tax=Agarivorans sp. DSG3-1 TaxID=3342249 RepID=UPI00398E413E
MNHFFNLNEKVAVITGGTSGIGAATAERLANAGATVVVAGRKNAQEFAERLGGSFVKIDVSDETSVKNLMAVAHDLYGKSIFWLTVLV